MSHDHQPQLDIFNTHSRPHPSHPHADDPATFRLSLATYRSNTFPFFMRNSKSDIAQLIAKTVIKTFRNRKRQNITGAIKGENSHFIGTALSADISLIFGFYENVQFIDFHLNKP